MATDIQHGTPIARFRKAKDRFFGTSQQSPLTAGQREVFAGLAYYDVDHRLVFRPKVQEIRDKKLVDLQTSTGDVAKYFRWGRVSISVEGRAVALTIFQGVNNEVLFLPFRDATAGLETYASGRYLEPELRGDRVLLDFNYAYNPYCAYDDRWSCPLTPPENRLDVPIRAGEKTYQAGHTEPGVGTNQ